MLDVDRMESQLQSASKVSRRAPRPAGPPRLAAPAIPPAIAAPSARVLARLRASGAVAEPVDPAAAPPVRVPARTHLEQLLDDGELAMADRYMAEDSSRRERLSWATMRALLDGREDAARAANGAMHDLAREDRDPEAMDRYWFQRFSLVEAWGSADERREMTEHCRDLAYRADDVQWTAALAVLLAQRGDAAEEAGEAFDQAFARLGGADESVQLDVATNLVEAAASLGDAFLASRLHYTLAWTPGRMVTVGDGWVCKGAIERFQALGQAAVGMFDEADAGFAHAVARHRAIGAPPLLARTLHQWGTTLVGRDDVRAAACLREAGALASDLELTDRSLLEHRRAA